MSASDRYQQSPKEQRAADFRRREFGRLLQDRIAQDIIGKAFRARHAEPESFAGAVCELATAEGLSADRVRWW